MLRHHTPLFAVALLTACATPRHSITTEVAPLRDRDSVVVTVTANDGGARRALPAVVVDHGSTVHDFVGRTDAQGLRTGIEREASYSDSTVTTNVRWLVGGSLRATRTAAQPVVR